MGDIPVLMRWTLHRHFIFSSALAASPSVHHTGHVTTTTRRYGTPSQSTGEEWTSSGFPLGMLQYPLQGLCDRSSQTHLWSCQHCPGVICIVGRFSWRNIKKDLLPRERELVTSYTNTTKAHVGELRSWLELLTGAWVTQLHPKPAPAW